MKFNRLGQTGLFVSELCMGTWGFSGRNYFGGAIGTLSQKDATSFIGRALEARINFIDTANVYSFGDSELMTGQALKELGVKRSDVVLATKVFGRMGPGYNDMGASRGHIMDSVALSLERLQTDHIDLYQIHHSDPITLQLDDGRWQLSWQRADEPGEGETQLSIITSDPASNAPMIEHILSQHDIHKIREALGLMGEQAGAEAGTMLEAVR